MTKIADEVRITLKPIEGMSAQAVIKACAELFYNIKSKKYRNYVYAKPEHTYSGQWERIVFSGSAPRIRSNCPYHLTVSEEEKKKVWQMFDADKVDPIIPAKPVQLAIEVDFAKEFKAAVGMMKEEFDKLPAGAKADNIRLVECWLHHALIDIGKEIGGGQHDQEEEKA